MSNGDFFNCNLKAKSFQPQCFELLREVNIYLDKTAKIDPAHKLEHLARLDYVIGFNGASLTSSSVQSSYHTESQAPAKEVALERFPSLEEKILSSDKDDVLFAIKALERKSSQEYVYSPQDYFETVLADRNSKRHEQLKAA